MQQTPSMKEAAGISLAEMPFPRFVKDCFHPLLMRIARSAISFRIVMDNTCAPLPNRPILFAANHYCGQDVVIAANAIGHRVLVVAGKQPLAGADEFFFNANGTIFVDRKDPADRAACKRAMCTALKQKQDVLIFPEGTSNVSPSLPMSQMKWGLIEVAQQTGAQIIPMVLHYDREKQHCHVRFCPPMTVEDMSKQDAIALLRDTMASVRWEAWASRGMFLREKLDVQEEDRKNKELLLAYPLLDYAYEQSVVYHPYPTEQEVFAPIEKIKQRIG